MTKKTKKIIGLLLAGLISISISGVGATAQEKDPYESLLRQMEENSKYIPEDFVAEPLTKGLSPDRGTSFANSYIPDLNTLPDVRNQSPYGSCWAHSSIFLAEQSMLKKYSSLNAREIDYSELALAYFLNHSVVDPLKGTEGDRNFAGEGHDWLDDGGNLAYSSQVLASWTGATAESKVPYNSVPEDYSSFTIDSKYAYDDEAHLQGYYVINLKTDRDEAKKAILDYGAVGVSYYSNTQAYYNSSTNSYYCYLEKGTNHAVAIVGWDDNFSKDNFVKDRSGNGPDGDGAWLIRNSWGYSNTSTYSIYRYFWISYYDKSLANVWAFDFEEADNYDNNYQYDGAAFSSTYSSSEELTVANVFEVKACDLGETLEAVSFATDTASLTYKIDIYKNPEVGNPESGTKVATKTGSTTFQGYYTVKLDNSVALSKGDTFSAVVKLSKPDAWVSIKAEYESSYWFSTEASAKANQSYLKTGSGYWYDYGASNDESIRIKAFTKNIDSEDLPISISITNVENGALCLGIGEKFTLDTKAVPNNAYNQVNYSSSNKAVATIDEKGQITALSSGTTTICAKSKVCAVTSSFTLTVEDVAYKIEIDDNINTSIDFDDEVQLEYSTLPANKQVKDTIVWTSSNEQVITVSDRGLVKAVGIGTADVTAQLRNSESTIRFTVSGRGIAFEYNVSKDSTITIEWDKSDEYSQVVIESELNGVKKTEKTVTFGESEHYSVVIDSYKNHAQFDTVTISMTPKPGNVTYIRQYYIGPWGKVEWVLDKGVNSPDNVSEYSANDYYLSLEDASAPDGYQFDGWYIDADYSERADVFYYVHGNEPTDLKFYGKVTPIEYTIYYLNSSIYTNTASLVQSYTIEDDDIELVDPTYSTTDEFAGWYTDYSYSDQIEKITKGSTGDLYLYDKRHRWYTDAGRVTKAATCMEEGEISYPCQYGGCTETKKVSTPKLTTHSLNNGEVTTPATCHSDGEKTYSCTVPGCTYTKTEPITTRPDHTWNQGQINKAATCVSKGEKTYTCTVTGCGQTRTEDIEKLTTHQLDRENGQVTVAATCHSDGEKTYSCTVPGCTYTETEPITTRPNHNWDEGQITSQSTCVTHGIKTHYCTNQGCSATNPEELPLTDEHLWNDGVITTQPTCVTKGVKTYSCKRTGCQASYTEDVDIVVTHTWDAGQETKAATCVSKGEKTYTCTVTGCGKTKTEDIEKLTTHQLDRENGQVTVAATCHSDGEKTYSCTVPGCTYTETEPITTRPDHNWDEGQITSQSTCVTHGIKTHYCTNQGCSETNPEELPLTDEHLWNDGEITTQPTCMTKGVKTYSCKRTGCQASYTEDVDIVDTHTWDEGQINKAATCVEEGEMLYTCTIAGCGQTRTEVIEKLTTHQLDMENGVVTVEVTCHSDGEVIYYCSVDGCDYSETVAITDRPDHTWDQGKTTKTATCTRTGVKTYTCTVEECGETRTEDIAKTKHKSVTKLTPASIKKDGEIKKYCSVCKTTLSKATIARAFIVCDETQKYTGKALTPVKIVDANGKTISKTNYTITYKNNTKIGKATAKITFKGNYKNSPVTKTFYIAKADRIPAKVNNVKLVADKKGFTVSWKMLKSKTLGYEIQYSLDKTFLTGVKTVKITSPSTTKKSITKLTSKKSYYVRMRAYNKPGSTVIYSPWTAVSTAVKTK